MYDVAILGAGIAGSALACILARQGLDVVVLEAGAHPRFAIGESMILESSELLRALAALYDVPELAWFSSEHFLPEAGTSHGVKRHFGFLWHEAGEPADPSHAIQAIIPEYPHGHELHLYRQDSDYRLAMAAISYGADVRQRTRVEHVELGEDAVTVHTSKGPVCARYVVDSAGFGSVLSRQLDLRRHDLQTRSRAIFSHCLHVDDVATNCEPFAWSEGTLHHLFEGGWMWVIPFGNHKASTNPLCSVGVMLDPDVWPESDLDAEAELHAIAAAHPTIAAQLARMRPVRDWTRTGRLQYRAEQVVGDRWCLLGHAAGFVDPLFSKGLYVALSAVATASQLLIEAKRTDDWSADAFRPLQRQTHAFVDANDALVANAYRSFAHPDLWRAFSTLWLAGAYTELLALFALRERSETGADYVAGLQQLHLAGGGFEGFDALAADVYAALEDVTDPQATAAVLRARLDAVPWLPRPFRDVLHGATYLTKNKVRPDMFRPGRGFLSSGAYRRHFFGRKGWLDVVRQVLVEAWAYSWPALMVRRLRLSLRAGGHGAPRTPAH